MDIVQAKIFGSYNKGHMKGSENKRMVWVGRDLKDCLVPTPLPWAGTSSTRPRCSKHHPTWPWALPGRGHPQLLSATCSSASPPSWWRTSSLYL